MKAMGWVLILCSSLVLAQDLRVPPNTKQVTISGLCNKQPWRAWRSLDGLTLYVTCGKNVPNVAVKELIPRN